jgi:hypothetical protein
MKLKEHVTDYQQRMWGQVTESLTELNLAIHCPPVSLLDYTLGDFVRINHLARKLSSGLQALEQIAHGNLPPERTLE